MCDITSYVIFILLVSFILGTIVGLWFHNSAKKTALFKAALAVQFWLYTDHHVCPHCGCVLLTS